MDGTVPFLSGPLEGTSYVVPTGEDPPFQLYHLVESGISTSVEKALPAKAAIYRLQRTPTRGGWRLAYNFSGYSAAFAVKIPPKVAQGL